MSNKIKYYPKTKPGDIQQIHPDGGGMIMTTDFKALVSETNNDVVNNLNESFFRGEIKTLPKNMSGMWVYSQTSPSLSNNISLGNENISSLITQNPTPVAAQQKSSDCEEIGTIINSSTNLNIYRDIQFERIVATFSEHENAYSTPNWNNYNSLPTYPNGTADLEWGNYGSGKSTFIEQRIHMYNRYWSTSDNIENSFNLSNYPNKEELKKLCVYTLPIGIRPYALLLNYNAGDHISRILNTVFKLTNGSLGLSYVQTTNITSGNFPEDPLNLLSANGSTYKREENGSLIYNGNDPQILKFQDTIPKLDRAKYFIDNYNKIINEYNNNKELFLSILKEVIDNFYKRLCTFRYDLNSYKKDNKIQYEARWIDKKNKLLQFYKEYANLAQKISSDTKNCDNKNAISSPTVTTQSNPINNDGKPVEDTRPQYEKMSTELTPQVKSEVIKTPIESSTNSTGVNTTAAKNKENEVLEKIVNPPTSEIEGDGYEGLYNRDFSSIPSREIKFDPELYYPDGEINDPSSPSEEDLINDEVEYKNVSDEESKITKGATVTVNLGRGGAGGGQGKNPGSYNLNILTSSGAIQDPNVLNKVLTLKEGANNVLELAMRQNPSNFPGKNLINPKLPKFLKSTKCTDPVNQNPVLVGIGNIMGPYNGIFGRKSVFCASGISFSFIVFNSNSEQLKTKSTINSGGFPCSPSSYIVPSKEFKGAKESFIYNVDFNVNNGELTKTGLEKWERIKQYKGAIYTVGNVGSGHIGMIIYVTTAGKKYDFFTLEWNVGGGDLKFLHRRFGDDYGARNGGKLTNIYIGDTSGFTGGSYATNGLGSDYNVAGVGSIFQLCKDNFPRTGAPISTSA
jgi:hypothetical protein